MPQSVADSREMEFVDRVEKDNLQTLSLDELAQRFEDIEQQGQLLQGRILLEARERFRSDNDFGAWIEQVGGAIYSTSRQHRTKLMNLARFFENRPIEKISISAAYEISAPINADIAIEVYEYAKGKNLPLAEVRKQIEKRKKPAEENEHIPVRIIPTDKPLIVGKPIEERIIIDDIEIVATKSEECLMSKEQQILDILKDLSDGEQLKILREVTRTVNDRMRPSR